VEILDENCTFQMVLNMKLQFTEEIKFEGVPDRKQLVLGIGDTIHLCYVLSNQSKQ